MPPLDGGKRVAAKYGPSRDVIAEMISVEKDLSQIKSDWIAKGWDVTSQDWQDAKDLGGMLESFPVDEHSVTSDGRRRVLICTREDETIAAVAQDPILSSSQTLLLIRLSPK